MRKNCCLVTLGVVVGVSAEVPTLACTLRSIGGCYWHLDPFPDSLDQYLWVESRSFALKSCLAGFDAQ